jgi:uncharacterized protein YecE (DUF72 family)
MVNAGRQIPLYLGTMGFSYKDWKGAFYPSQMDPKDYLSYYSRIFNSVEIDSTFYGAPKKTTIQHWASATPPSFVFSLKAPRTITHELGLVNAWALTAEFLDAVRQLGERLGVILFQFPPSFTSVNLVNLAAFLPKLPHDLRFAIEIRNPSWYSIENELVDLLAGFGIGWAATQYPNLPARIQHCSKFIYIRWIGQHGSFRQHDHERIDRLSDLHHWWDIIQENMPGMPELFGYFNNDYAGFAVGTALKFKALSGEKIDLPQQARQARLL